MTAAHSAGTAVFSSLRQLATMASRSTVSTPVMVASAAAMSASGEGMSFASDGLGSMAMVMGGVFTRQRAPVQLPVHACDRYHVLIKCRVSREGQEGPRGLS